MSENKWNSGEITVALAGYQSFDYTKKIVVPRCTLPGWEADLLVMQPKTGFLDEVEIKVSVSDFRREFKEKAWKHDHLVNGHLSYSRDYRYPTKIRRYWMAMPREIYDKIKDEIPAYAGIIVFDRWGRNVIPTIVRKPQNLKNSRALEPDEQFKLMRLAYLRFWDKETKSDLINASKAEAEMSEEIMR